MGEQHPNPDRIIEPKTYLQATKSPQAEHWIQAMQEEYNSLLRNGTWSLIDLPTSRIVV